MRRIFSMVLPLSVVSLLLLAAPAASGAKTDPEKAEATELPSIAEKTRGLEHKQGLLDLHLDRKQGTVWLVVPAPGEHGVAGEYLYLEGLASGLGSNDVGLDRGQLGDTQLVQLRRLGTRVLLEAQNTSFRALSPEQAERRAVRQSFATSVLWGAEIQALDADGRSLVDLTTLLVRDAHGVERRLESADQGSFTLDDARSAVDPEGCLAFADNVELEAVLTYTSAKPGPQVRATAPAPQAVTIVQHHSFVRLPDAGYRPRTFDPRMPSGAVSFLDYAAPLAEPLEKRWIRRHRLQKVDPAAERSPAKDPIVYYVDRGAPEPVRSALLEGARWWAQAFETAGFVDGYRVELLPEGAHPLDVRYNVIQWVHRSTRGWSYGNSITDPRTGEIIKGHVSLGSLRVRQDILIFEGLAGADRTGSGNADDPVELALARIRQLSAHEVGHTLGFTHNYAASTYADRASVMDYPAPLVRLGADRELDFSRVYGVGLGPWDVHGVRYAYSHFAPGADEDSKLREIIRAGLDSGLLFLADADAHPPGAAHPLTSLWDNGADPVDELATVLAVRHAALARFGEPNVAAGRPLALLEEALVPLYLYHRYQVEAAAKVLGGLTYSYSVRGDGQTTAAPVDARWQRRALDALLSALDPQILDLPESILTLLVPRPFGYQPHRELLAGNTSPAFDALAAATTASDLVVRVILQPQRLARLLDFHRRDASLPGVEEVVAALISRVFADPEPGAARLAEIVRVQQWVVAERMIELAADDDTSSAVRARLEAALRDVILRLERSTDDPAESAHRQALGLDLRRYLERREWRPATRPPALPAPPGSPIGTATW